MPVEFSKPPNEYSGFSMDQEFPNIEISGKHKKDTVKKSATHDFLKKMFLAPVLGIVTVLAVISSATGVDLISTYFGESLGSIGNFFPILPNLEPNGFVSFANYGILDEEYVLFESLDGTGSDYLWAGSAYGDQSKEIDGAVYDSEKNTLTLTDFDGSNRILNINLMGNGFTLTLEGNNSLGGILAWGFHYGGSITVNGTGSLIVNENKTQQIGIILQAEASESCFMIDGSIKYLESSGEFAAFMVYESTHSRGLYISSPLSLSEGTGSEYKDDEESHDEPYMHGEPIFSSPKTHNYTIINQYGDVSEFFSVGIKN